MNQNDRNRPRKYYAHSANDDGQGVCELLSEHLRRVAETAARFAALFGADEQACAAGLLHDLGKYTQRFQQHLFNANIRAGDHWSAGAGALAAYYESWGIYPALAVLGHHAGLSRLYRKAKLLCREINRQMTHNADKFTGTDVGSMRAAFQADGFSLPAIHRGFRPTENGHLVADMLDVRMLFSALVDADFLETEAHFNGNAQEPRRPRPPGPKLDVQQGIAALEKYIDQMRKRYAHSPMRRIRDELLDHCIRKAEEPTGLFTLAAPTGAGKTLAMLAFALHHARRHNLRRIVLVMPFLNIIDQTAQVYRCIFSQENGFSPHTVLEHHSLAEYEENPDTSGTEDYSRSLPRLLAENWDAPVVLTTTVQFFESLFANRPSRCRKLHRLARSVILFDEVQTLPPHLAVATLAALSRLADPQGPYGSTVLFATATQPSFEALDNRVRQLAPSGWQPREIVPDPAPLYGPASQRVRICWRHQEPLSPEELADELAGQERSTLCIVNLKRHAATLARLLHERLGRGVLHLSTNMCPAHRAAVLDQVRKRLSAGQPLWLVATQCVEAGVDLDFPLVYRALGPLEAVAQAAGRCNRHGQREQGTLVVFQLKDQGRSYPPGYGEAVDATETFLNLLAEQGDLNQQEIINNPQRIREYFRHLYAATGRSSTDFTRADEAKLLDAIQGGNFEEVAQQYRLISKHAINIIVPYEPEKVKELRGELLQVPRLTPGAIRRWMGRATPYAVNIYRPDPQADIWNYLEPIQFSRRQELENDQAQWFRLLDPGAYDPLVGLTTDSFDPFVI